MSPEAALVQLLSDPSQRRRFLSDRSAWLTERNLDPARCRALLELNSAELEVQAEVLIDKRLAEVSDLLPETLSRLGTRAARLFRAYAPSTWPEGHLQDALRFLAYVEQRDPCAPSSRDWAYVRAQLAWRQGSRLSWGVSRHADQGPLSSLVLVFAGRGSFRRFRLPLPLWTRRRTDADAGQETPN